MCETNPKPSAIHAASAGASTEPSDAAAEAVGSSPLPGVPSAREAPTGSRRRRLWELDPPVHCPVLGACLPIGVLRRLVGKVLGGQAVAVDYELHCGGVNACRSRSPLAEAMQKELDRRHAPMLRQAAAAKTVEALAAWWSHHRDGPGLPGAFWATLTHPRCTETLRHQVMGELHMLQHQVGVASRVEQQQRDAVRAELAALRQTLGLQQQRHQEQAAVRARELAEARAEVATLQAHKRAQDQAVLRLREQLAAQDAALPGLASRVDLAAQNRQQAQRLAELELQLRLAQREATRQRERAHAAEAAASASHRASVPADVATPQGAGGIAPAAGTAATALGDRAVLCVGGRPASVPLYRHIVERTGGRFLHHDGGDEESVSRLEATLSAADLVVCQTGCISHDAYWRVKHYCKRTGKPCVFVESPGGASLKRALAQLPPAPSRPLGTAHTAEAARTALAEARP